MAQRATLNKKKKATKTKGARNFIIILIIIILSYEELQEPPKHHSSVVVFLAGPERSGRRFKVDLADKRALALVCQRPVAHLVTLTR